MGSSNDVTKQNGNFLKPTHNVDNVVGFYFNEITNFCEFKYSYKSFRKEARMFLIEIKNKNVTYFNKCFPNHK